MWSGVREFVKTGWAGPVVLMAVIAVIVSATRPSGLYRLDGYHVRLIRAAIKDTRVPNAADPLIGLRDQRGALRGQARQIHVRIEPERLQRGTMSIHIPDLDGPAHLYVGNVETSHTRPRAHIGLGQGAYGLDARIEPLREGEMLRVDLRQDRGWTGTGVGPIYVGPVEALRAASLRRIWVDGLSRVISILATGLASFVAVSLAFRPGLRGLAAGFALLATGLGLCHVGLGHAVFGEISRMGAVAPPVLVLIGFGVLTVGARRVMATRGVLRFAALGAGLALIAVLGMLSPVWMPVLGLLARVATLGSLACVLIAGWLVYADLRARDRAEVEAARARIAEQDATIAAQDAALQAGIRRAAVMEERQRFTRDMHDGIGSQLTSLLIRVRSGTADLDVVEAEVQSGLADLRNIVDSFDYMSEDFGQALANFRSRAGQMVRGADLDFVWDQPQTIQPVGLDSRDVLSLYRLLTEAVTNAVRHADAERISVGVVDAPDGITFVVQDDGQGFEWAEVEAGRVGRGLRSLRERAEGLGARLDIVPMPGKGTRVTLEVPRRD